MQSCTRYLTLKNSEINSYSHRHYFFVQNVVPKKKHSKTVSYQMVRNEAINFIDRISSNQSDSVKHEHNFEISVGWSPLPISLLKLPYFTTEWGDPGGRVRPTVILEKNVIF